MLHLLIDSSTSFLLSLSLKPYHWTFGDQVLDKRFFMHDLEATGGHSIETAYKIPYLSRYGLIH